MLIYFSYFCVIKLVGTLNYIIAKLITAFKNYKGEVEKNPITFSICGDGTDFIRIDQFKKHPSYQDEMTSYQRFTYYLVTGSVMRYTRNMGEVTEIFENVELLVTMTEEKNEKGIYQIVRIDIPDRFENSSFTRKTYTEEENTSILRPKTMKRFGFEAIYKKQSTFERSVFTEEDVERNELILENLFKTYITDFEKGHQLIEQLVDPSASNRTQIIASYDDFFKSCKSYLIELKAGDVSCTNSFSLREGDPSTLEMFYDAGLIMNRNAASDKNLIKQYLAAGITKATIKKNGAQVSNEADQIKMMYKNNKWVITSELKPRFVFDMI